MLPQTVFHSASVEVRAATEDAFRYIRQGKNLHDWLVGTPEITQITPERYQCSRPEIRHIAIDCHRPDDGQGAVHIYFDVGPKFDLLQRRIMVKITPLKENHSPDPGCHIELIAGRTSDMTDARWRDVCRRHDREAQTLKEILSP